MKRASRAVRVYKPARSNSTRSVLYRLGSNKFHEDEKIAPQNEEKLAKVIDDKQRKREKELKKYE
jgi:hypothetical protein